jgi:hypothetical protein
MAACRVCGESHNNVRMIKYSTRHYAHADCALKKYGAEFFNRLNHHQLGNFPIMIARKAGLRQELETAYNL